MTPWIETTLGSICDIKIGGTPSRSNPLFWDVNLNESNHWVSIRDLDQPRISSTAERITTLGVNRSNAKPVRKGTVLLSFKLTIGKVAIADVDLFTNEAIAALETGTIDNDFLFHGLHYWNLLQDVDQAIKGATLNKAKLFKIRIRIPEDRSEQERIAEILSTVDAAIEHTQALIDKYGRIKRGLLQDLLTRGIDENGNLRSKETHKFTVKNGIEVPDEWEVVSLADLRKSKDYLRTGPFGSSLKISDWTETGIPVITIGSLGENTIDPTNLLFVDQQKAETLSLYRLEPGDVLFSRVADVGRSLVITDKEAGWIMSSNFMRLRIDSQRMLPTFLHINLKENRAVKNQILKCSNYGGRDLVNSEVLNSLYFPKPNPLEQERIIEKVHAFERVARSLDKLQSIKKGLMQDLLSGRKRVKVDA